MRRTLVLAALAAFCFAASPVFAAATDQEKFEKKVGRFAQPVAVLDFAKPRGLCACQSDDAAVRGLTGVLIYGIEEGMSTHVVKVGCQIPVFDLAGTRTGETACENWTLLSR